jgi:CHC2 zinc finger
MSIDFDTIRERNPLGEYCGSRGIKLRKSGERLVGKCPIHNETNGSAFVVRDGRWKCFGKCNRSGDVIDLEQALGGGTLAEAAERLRSPSAREETKPRIPNLELRVPRVLNLSGIEKPSARDCEQISKLRKISMDGLMLARERNLLFCYDHPHEGRCWLITDDARRNAIYRRLDGKCFGASGGGEGPKSRCWKGAEANWPIGIMQGGPYPTIALCEGAPDFLAAFELAYCGAVETLVAPVCMASASGPIHRDALSMFRGKRVRIFADADEAGYNAMQKWTDQLYAIHADIDPFFFNTLKKADASPVKDLNDFLFADHKASGCVVEITTGAFDFALEENAR